MRLHLTTAYHQGVALRFLRAAARLDRAGVHQTTDDPAAADAILFVENYEPRDPFYGALPGHPLARRFADRAFMYNECDRPYRVLPGLYASMPRRSFDAARQVAFTYLFHPNEFVSRIPEWAGPRDLLYSFVGAPNHRMRRRLLALADPRAHLEDTTAFSIWRPAAPEEVTRRKRVYAELMARSGFVLCPRGAGTSSYRLFEAMEAGRAPVVISDQWVATEGPDWDGFLLRCAERDLEWLPGILREREAEAVERGRAARAAWERWFAPDVVFHHAAEAIARLIARQPACAGWREWLPDSEHVRVRAAHVVMGGARGALGAFRRLRRARPTAPGTPADAPPVSPSRYRTAAPGAPRPP